MDPHLLTSIIILLSISCFVATLAQWLKQPYTIALVLIGLVISFTKLTSDIYLTYDVTFSLILPPLLFYGAMHVDIERLKSNWKTIALLAVPGVICSTFFIGFLLYRFLGMPWLHALLFGALITPTDPISVISILRRVGAPQRLRIILEGESLFNDGTGVVIFAIILAMIGGREDFPAGEAITQFFLVTGGGTLVGLLVGYMAYRVMRSINDHLHEVLITVVLVFGTPILAETLHCSGIIAVVVAGLIMGNYGTIYSMSEKTRETLETFWEVIDFMINSLLFIMIGVELQVINKTELISLWRPITFAIFAVLLSRLIVVYPVIGIKNFIDRKRIPLSWGHILFWSGLKGSIPIALVVGLPPDVVHRDFFLTVAFAVVLFSLVVQGLSMKPLVAKLGLKSV